MVLVPTKKTCRCFRRCCFNNYSHSEAPLLVTMAGKCFCPSFELKCSFGEEHTSYWGIVEAAFFHLSSILISLIFCQSLLRLWIIFWDISKTYMSSVDPYRCFRVLQTPSYTQNNEEAVSSQIPLRRRHVLVSCEGQRSVTARSDASRAGRALVFFSTLQQGRTCFLNYCVVFLSF